MTTRINHWMLGLGLMLSMNTQALELEIQGEKTLLSQPGATCIQLAGEYKNLRIEASEAGKTPLLCFNSRRQNALTLHHATFISTADEAQTISVRFWHDFNTGPRGLVYARIGMNGFFAKATGTEAPEGNSVQFTGYFIQGGSEDVVGDVLDTEVGVDLESALFELKSRDQYLTSGARGLRGEFIMRFAESGDKLVLHEGTSLIIDQVKRFDDKLEETNQ